MGLTLMEGTGLSKSKNSMKILIPVNKVKGVKSTLLLDTVVEDAEFTIHRSKMRIGLLVTWLPTRRKAKCIYDRGKKEVTHDAQLTTEMGR